jgi:large subunit ribosomal protein L23
MSLFSNKSQTEEKGGKKTAKATPAEAKKPSMKELYGDEATKKEVVSTGDNKSVEAAVAGKKPSANKLSGVLVKPLVTEKGSILGAENKYLFMVAIDANKIKVAEAVEAAYGVKPTKVNIINIEGKTKNRGRIVGKRKDWKKAIVTLPEGKTIQVYEGI